MIPNGRGGLFMPGVELTESAPCPCAHGAVPPPWSAPPPCPQTDPRRRPPPRSHPSPSPGGSEHPDAHPPPACVQVRGGEGKRVGGGASPCAHGAHAPRSAGAGGGADGVRMREGGGACVQARGGCRRVQTRATVSRKTGGCGRTWSVSTVCRGVYKQHVAPHTQDKTRIVGNPHDSGSRLANHQQQQLNFKRHNTMTPWGHGDNRGRVSPDPQGVRFPR